MSTNKITGYNNQGQGKHFKCKQMSQQSQIITHAAQISPTNRTQETKAMMHHINLKQRKQVQPDGNQVRKQRKTLH
jgi:hypothetical protein